MSGNEARGRHEAEHWAKFDSLPFRFRELLRLAHTNYQVGWVRARIRDLGSNAAFDSVRRELWCERRKDILAAYGPTHPELSR